MFLGVPFAGFITSERWRRPALWIAGIAVAALAFIFLGVPALRMLDAEISASALSAQAERVPAWSGRAANLPGRVVHVRDTDATFWDYGTDWYGDYIDQDVVTAMVTEGLLTLTGTQSVHSAWQVLIPDFEPGQRLAIKVNFNNVTSLPPGDDIDAVIEPVNALLGGLIDYGFAPSDITVFDVTNTIYHSGLIPQRFIDGCDYPGVNFEGWVTNGVSFSSTDAIVFNPPSGPGISNRRIARCLAEADYLINMPISKVHDYAGLTLTFKNHFGSFNRCDYAHNYVFTSSPYWSPDYSPLVDIWLNEHFGGKNVLILNDLLFGNWEHLFGPPTPWPSFGNGAPNSILLATDPVAIDCVAADFLAVEGNVPAGADQYLVLASAAGLGVFERAPSPGVYSIIDYTYLEGPFDGTGVNGGGPEAARPQMLTLPQNPVSDTASIHLELPMGYAGKATVRLYDVRGRLVRTLVEDETLTGSRDLSWDGRDDSGVRAASGVYWITLDYEGTRETARVVLVR
jgi:uncharacterized protein (DUF362 family)